MTCKSCNPPLTAGPNPYYNQVHREVVQDHTQVFSQLCHAIGVHAKASWVIPEANEEVVVELANVTSMVVNAYLYHPFYGYFRIVSWNQGTGKANLLNEEISGTQAPGTTVPEGVSFLVVPRPCCEEEGYTLLPFVAEDFEAPAISASIVLKVTSTFSIQVNDYVRIGTGVYLVEDVATNGYVTVKNEGAGITPGTDVDARDASGNYQYLLSREIPSACENAVLAEIGALIVCDNGTQTTLDSDKIGKVPYIIDATSNVVRAMFPDAAVRPAGRLLNSLSVDTTSNSYNVNVSEFVSLESSFLSIGDLVELEGLSNVTFVITGYSGATVTITIPSRWAKPLSNQTIPAGAYLKRSLPIDFLYMQNRIVQVTSTGGTANAQTFATYAPGAGRAFKSLTSYPAGFTVIVTPSANNTGPLTFNAGITADAVEYAAKPLIGGEFRVGKPVTLVHDGVSKWMLKTPPEDYIDYSVVAGNLAGSGSMTVGTLSSGALSLKNLGTDIRVVLNLSGLQLNGTASNIIVVDLGAITGLTLNLSSANQSLVGQNFDAVGGYGLCIGEYNAASKIQVTRSGRVNYGIGSGHAIYLAGEFRRA